jgi:hypothetical protein
MLASAALQSGSYWGMSSLMAHNKLTFFSFLPLLLLPLTSCADPEIRDAEKLVQATLSDPSSAQFSETAVSGRRAGVVCGIVNSKNKFGGYAGPRRFYVELASGNTQIDPGETVSAEAREMFGPEVMDSAKFSQLHRQFC